MTLVRSAHDERSFGRNSEAFAVKESAREIAQPNHSGLLCPSECLRAVRRTAETCNDGAVCRNRMRNAWIISSIAQSSERNEFTFGRSENGRGKKRKRGYKCDSGSHPVSFSFCTIHEPARVRVPSD